MSPPRLSAVPAIPLVPAVDGVERGIRVRRAPKLRAVEGGAPTAKARIERARRVLFVTSEMADYIKAGGLGDVAASLPRALRGRSDVRVLIPGYDDVIARAPDLRLVGRVPARAGIPACDIGEATLADGLPVLVLVCPELYQRGGSPYVDGTGQDWSDNAVRFAALSRAAAVIACGSAGLDWQPELLHLNDWPCALAAAYLRWYGSDVPALLTIHNLAYQGLFPVELADALGVSAEQAQSILFHGRLSFLQAGIVHADQVNTVSVSYARQITGPEQGCGLDALLSSHAASGRLSGIVNGIDNSWDPRTDLHLTEHFDLHRWEGRVANKRRVQRALGLPHGDGPLFAVVSRLVHQKGLDLSCAVAHQIAAAGGQLAIIGDGDPRIAAEVAALSRRFPSSVGVFAGFDEALARKMFAGADFLLMPSRFEPCGLSQMYAQRFGCLPIAHATGGLIDTIEDGVTGLLFDSADADSLRRCVQRAFRTYRLPTLLSAMRRAAMLRPSSWEQAGTHYLSLYDRAMEQRA
ncbi:glycogen synthase GlgA [uncultured Stenotrophomonas sp.]|uniref:glycogen synthase GlgA n=1 Tax=uncultured Stenotrophomonas sp. TaxID=165438 RepID=UPI0028E5107A|nr:glycogen synthase GlgA [uncultured Stenotrophomonas sp.]